MDVEFFPLTEVIPKDKNKHFGEKQQQLPVYTLMAHSASKQADMAF